MVQILRHPIKSVGVEALSSVVLDEGRALPWDRHWAVTHAGARFDGDPDGWQPKLNFLRGVTAPGLMAIRSRLDTATGHLTLTHPEAGDITADPMRDGARFVDWLRPIWGDDEPAPRALVSAPDQAMTDRPEPFVSILGTASLDALSQCAGQDLSPHRFRGNLWIEGWAPFEEFDLIGRTLSVGPVQLEIRERITRCKATLANPDTGRRDIDTLSLLKDHFGHQDLGVYAVVTAGGEIAPGDAVHVA